MLSGLSQLHSATYNTVHDASPLQTLLNNVSAEILTFSSACHVGATRLEALESRMSSTSTALGTVLSILTSVLQVLVKLRVLLLRNVSFIIFVAAVSYITVSIIVLLFLVGAVTCPVISDKLRNSCLRISACFGVSLVLVSLLLFLLILTFEVLWLLRPDQFK